MCPCLACQATRKIVFEQHYNFDPDFAERAQVQHFIHTITMDLIEGHLTTEKAIGNPKVAEAVTKHFKDFGWKVTNTEAPINGGMYYKVNVQFPEKKA